MCREMQFAINRQVVIDGLNRRAEAKAAAEREAELEAFEEDMIRRCNDRYEAAHLQQRMDEDVRTCRDRCESNISGRAYIKERKKQLRKDVALSCLIYFAFAVVIFWLTTWTYLPLWGAAAYVAAGAMILAARLFVLRCDAEAEGIV